MVAQFPVMVIVRGLPEAVGRLVKISFAAAGPIERLARLMFWPAGNVT